MTDLCQKSHQVQCVTNFQDLVSTPFQGDRNAMGWVRDLVGDFAEIVEKVPFDGNMTILHPDELRELPLSEQGNLARQIILNDFELLKAHGADPTINLIRHYERDKNHPFFPTDVYSYHVDRSTVPADTFLCTYYGRSTEIVPNAQAIQKVRIPEVRDALKKEYQGADADFELYLKEHFYDLHYQPLPAARPFSVGVGHLWKLAIDYPESGVLPCLHRAPEEDGVIRLLLIC